MGNGADELLTALVGAFATLLAAGIAGVVAAGVFVTGEILKLRRSKIEKQTAAVEALASAWADVASVSAPRVHQLWPRRRRYPERVDVTAATHRLMSVLPRRDFELITFQERMNDELVRAPDDRRRIKAAATATAALTVWLANRRRGRRFARWHLEQRGIHANFDGSAAKKAREPRRVL